MPLFYLNHLASKQRRVPLQSGVNFNSNLMVKSNVNCPIVNTFFRRCPASRKEKPDKGMQYEGQIFIWVR